MKLKELKTSTIILGALILYAVFMSTWAFIKSPKIGYVESNLLLQKAKVSMTARNKIETQNKQWLANLKTLETELTQLNEAFFKEGTKWDKNTVTKKKVELDQKQSEYAKYNRAIQEKSAKMEEETMQPVFNELNAAMNDYAKSKGFDMVFGTIAGGNILYGSTATNITEDVIQYVNSR